MSWTPDLVANDDPDLAAWQGFDQATFLGMVCAEVRSFCGWHVAPSLSVVSRRVYLGHGGLAVLKSTMVTSVDAVTFEGETLTADCDYSWDEPKGWLRVHAERLPAPVRRGVAPSVDVSYTHGFADVPPDVKAVIFEVLATSMELPASNADDVETVQYKFKLKSSVGVALSQQQQERLGRYRLRSFGGLVRP